MFQICSIYHEKCRDFEKPQPWPRQLHTFLGFLGVMIHPHQVCWTYQIIKRSVSLGNPLDFVLRKPHGWFSALEWVDNLGLANWRRRPEYLDLGVQESTVRLCINNYQYIRSQGSRNWAVEPPPTPPRRGKFWMVLPWTIFNTEPKSWRPRPVPCSNSAWPSGSAWDVLSRSRIPILILHLDPAGG